MHLTVFAHCLNTFCKTWLIVSQQTSKYDTTLGHTPFTSTSNCNSAIETSKQFFVKMSLRWQNDTHLYHMNTLSDQQQHTSLLYINHCSLSYSLFLLTTKKSNTQYCTLQYDNLQCSKFSLSKNKTKIHYCTVNRKKSCAGSIHGLTVPRYLHRPVPSPAEEACQHVVGGYMRAISKPIKVFSIGFKNGK